MTSAMTLPDTTLTRTQHTVNLAARHAVPLLVLSPAAYISWLHLTGPLGYDPYVSGVIALALEILGYVTVDTLIAALHAKRWGSVIASGGAFVGYIVIIVSLNTVLNIATLIFPALLPIAKVLAEGVLVMLSVPAFFWAAARQSMTRIEQRETARDVLESNRVIELRKLEIAEAASIRAEKQAAKSAVAKQAPAPVVIAKPQAEKQPCKFGCGKMVTGTKGQNAHSDSCPNNSARPAQERET